MPAFEYEFTIAKKDGVTFLWQTQPVRVLSKGGAVTGLECVHTRLGGPDARGRRQPEPIPGSEFVLEVDMIVRAVGQKPATQLLSAVAGLQLQKDGTIAINEKHQTGNPKYFAAGDCTNGGKEVVDAVAEGKQAAIGMDAVLGSPRGRS